MKIKFNNGEFDVDPTTQDVKVEVLYVNNEVSIRYLESYDPNLKKPYLCFYDGKKRKEATGVTAQKNCNFIAIEPEERVVCTTKECEHYIIYVLDNCLQEIGCEFAKVSKDIFQLCKKFKKGEMQWLKK